MVYTPHLKVKPEVLAGAAVEALTDKLAIANTVTKRNEIAKFFASAGDTITVKVKGTLPVRTYTPRNDRSAPIVTDVYSESTQTVTLAVDRPYSAVKLTDEQRDWDFDGGWGDIIDTQMDTVGQYIEHGVLNQIVNAPYERIIVAKDSAADIAAATAKGQDSFYNLVIEAKKALRLMRTPSEQLVCIVGVDFEEALLKSNRLVKDEGRGDDALTSSTLGTIAGVKFVSSTHIPASEAFMYAPSGFIAFTGVPSIPKSVPFGATASANGWAVRHLLDYDSGYLTDRSVVDTYAGYSYTKDNIAVFNGESQAVISDERFFVRGVRLGLGDSGLTEKAPGDGSDTTPGGSPDSFLAKAYKLEHIAQSKPAGTPWPLGGNFPAADVTP